MAGATGFTSTGQPVRPYASPDQVPAGAESRSASFASGANHTGDVATSAGQDPGLNLNAQQFNAQAGGGYRPTSVLQPLMRNPGGLGMSAGDAARRLADGTPLGTLNGTSESSFEPAAMLRLSGLNAE